MVKVYIALFTCCLIRAVHLELVRDLHADTFLNCLRGFAASRGTPTLLVSDNGKTFKAAAKFIKKLNTNNELQTYSSSKLISW